MYDVVPNFDTSIHPTPSDPPDPPEQPQAPELNDGDSDVEEIAPQLPQQDATRTHMHDQRICTKQVRFDGTKVKFKP